MCAHVCVSEGAWRCRSYMWTVKYICCQTLQNSITKHHCLVVISQMTTAEVVPIWELNTGQATTCPPNISNIVFVWASLMETLITFSVIDNYNVPQGICCGTSWTSFIGCARASPEPTFVISHIYLFIIIFAPLFLCQYLDYIENVDVKSFVLVPIELLLLLLTFCCTV